MGRCMLEEDREAVWRGSGAVGPGSDRQCHPQSPRPAPWSSLWFQAWGRGQMKVRRRGGGGRDPGGTRMLWKGLQWAGAPPRPLSRFPGPALWRPHSWSAPLTRPFSGHPGQAQTVDKHRPSTGGPPWTRWVVECPLPELGGGEMREPQPPSRALQLGCLLFRAILHPGSTRRPGSQLRTL